ncbi:hypothetical protein WMY93_011648 [Mugilogobius chulae]|uniref:Uncharacterized protein n=1 Tax=Mugilogobius chulae TaxID=88201 RepID=A0AAW0P6N6_9GOBI
MCHTPDISPETSELIQGFGGFRPHIKDVSYQIGVTHITQLQQCHRVIMSKLVSQSKEMAELLCVCINPSTELCLLCASVGLSVISCPLGFHDIKEAIKSSLTILKQVMEEKLNATNIELATVEPGKTFHMFSKEELEDVIKDI